MQQILINHLNTMDNNNNNNDFYCGRLLAYLMYYYDNKCATLIESIVKILVDKCNITTHYEICTPFMYVFATNNQNIFDIFYNKFGVKLFNLTNRNGYNIFYNKMAADCEMKLHLYNIIKNEPSLHKYLQYFSNEPFYIDDKTNEYQKLGINENDIDLTKLTNLSNSFATDQYVTIINKIVEKYNKLNEKHNKLVENITNLAN